MLGWRRSTARRPSPSRSVQADRSAAAKQRFAIVAEPRRAAHFLVDGCTAGTMQKKTVANSRYASEYMLHKGIAGFAHARTYARCSAHAEHSSQRRWVVLRRSEAEAQRGRQGVRVRTRARKAQSVYASACACGVCA